MEILKESRSVKQKKKEWQIQACICHSQLVTMLLLGLPHRWPTINARNHGAEVVVLSLGHFTGLGVGHVPKRPRDSVCRRVPKRPTDSARRRDTKRRTIMI